MMIISNSYSSKQEFSKNSLHNDDFSCTTEYQKRRQKQQTPWCSSYKRQIPMLTWVRQHSFCHVNRFMSKISVLIHRNLPNMSFNKSTRHGCSFFYYPITECKFDQGLGLLNTVLNANLITYLLNALSLFLIVIESPKSLMKCCVTCRLFLAFLTLLTPYSKHSC